VRNILFQHMGDYFGATTPLFRLLEKIPLKF